MNRNLRSIMKAATDAPRNLLDQIRDFISEDNNHSRPSFSNTKGSGAFNEYEDVETNYGRYIADLVKDTGHPPSMLLGMYKMFRDSLVDEDTKFDDFLSQFNSYAHFQKNFLNFTRDSMMKMTGPEMIELMAENRLHPKARNPMTYSKGFDA